VNVPAPDQALSCACRLPHRRMARALVRWGSSSGADFPWRRRLPFWQGLVAEVLLQRTRASQVVPVFQELRRRYPSASRFAAASESEIANLIAPLGLRWRAPLLHRLALQIGERRGRLPKDEAELEALPGVGPYAAAAALSLHGEVRAIIVDTNVVRVLCRLVDAPYDAETRRKKWLRELAGRLTPDDDFRQYNYALLDLSRLLCRPAAPRCGACPLTSWCATGGTITNRGP
jgi:A/G-specific adenine glycosylase